MSEPEQGSIGHRVRCALLALNELFEDRKPGGVSISDMARGAKVSHTEFSRILAGDRKLGVDQIVGLPTPARRVVMAILNGANDAIEGQQAVSRTHDSRARRYAKLVGDHNALLDAAEADGVIDHVECERLRLSSVGIAAEATAGARDGVSS